MTPRAFDRFMVAVDLGSNLKVGRFTDAEFRCLVTGVWALAAKANPRGCLTVGGQPATSRDVARQGRCSAAVAEKTIEKMIKLGMLDYDGERDWYAVHDWDLVNPAPRSDSGNAERQRRFRERRRTGGGQSNGPRNGLRNGRVTSNVTGSHAREVEVEGEVPAAQVKTSSSEAEKHPVAARLSQRLAAHVRRNDPKASPNPESDSWVRDMRLLLQDRTGDVGEVERVIDWSQHDPFWHSNILSPAKLRRQFTQLLLKADGAAQVVPMRKPGPGDLIAKLRAAEEAS